MFAYEQRDEPPVATVFLAGTGRDNKMNHPGACVISPISTSVLDLMSRRSSTSSASSASVVEIETTINSNNITSSIVTNSYNSTTIISTCPLHETNGSATSKRRKVRFDSLESVAPAPRISVFEKFGWKGLSRLPHSESFVPQSGSHTLSISSKGTSASSIRKSRCRIQTELRKNIKFPKSIHNHRYMRSNLFQTEESIPLWQPSAAFNLPSELRESYVCVGDVGSFNNTGGFEVLFNVFLSEEDNKALGLIGTPPSFEPFPVKYSHEISSITTENQDVDFKRSDESLKRVPLEDAESRNTWVFELEENTSVSLLVLPTGYWSDRMTTQTMRRLDQHFKDRDQEWWNGYIIDQKDGSPPSHIYGGDLKIVTCTYKTRSWALARREADQGLVKRFFSKRRPMPIAKLFKPQEDADLYRWNCNGNFEAKTGPLKEELEDARRARFLNQCVAIEVSKISETRDVSSSIRSLRASVRSRTSASTVKPH